MSSAEHTDSDSDAEHVFHADGDPVDVRLDAALRPRTFDEFVGQRALRDNLGVYIQAARARDEPLDHLLLSGLPGLGKTTLAHIVARELGVECRTTSGPALARPGDLAGVLTNLAAGDLLFIDEIHRLHPTLEEYLYSAMEDYAIDIMIDQGPSARSVRVQLPRFTLVGATTREGQLSAPFRGRFGLVEKLELYPRGDLARIAVQSAERLGTAIDDDAAELLARCARGTPRVANRLIKRLRDFAQVGGEDRITLGVAENALTRIGIDERGLGPTDRRLIQSLYRAGGGPVGLKTIAVACGEDVQTVEDVYEPFLLTEGLLMRTPRGRRLTERAVRLAETLWPEDRPETSTDGKGLLF